MIQSRHYTFHHPRSEDYDNEIVKYFSYRQCVISCNMANERWLKHITIYKSEIRILDGDGSTPFLKPFSRFCMVLCVGIAMAISVSFC
jgi:hypothetical protein